MPISAAEVKIVPTANIETDKITTAKSISAVPLRSPISDMTAAREILFTMDTVQHQEPETDNKRFNDEHTQVEQSISNYPTAIPETTQNLVILPDEEFDEVVQTDLGVIKQAWAAMEKREKPFTPFISKSQKKKKKQLSRSVGQPYNTCSRGDTSHISL
ncbi:hypothetical protein L195_g043326 [Trifolium pratense]|uniref:Uncharacterized protein n=1 Tax=Trifolium pratense TaxID=57577 RepID=A0A2K3M8X7_TRIPR|nr:hypothetical protein L195_g043326 [Trifolium pratense]